jgi:hypothetical protein
VILFLDNDKQFPIITAVASGLYPLLYLYDKNFTLINSWSQLSVYALLFIVVPIVVTLVMSWLMVKTLQSTKTSAIVLTIINLCFFGFFIAFNSYGVKLKIIALIVTTAVIVAYVMQKHLKKIVVFQFILAAMVSVKLIPDIKRQLTYSEKWMQQPDNISAVVFKNKSNVYVIQPDGYANSKELKGQNYNFDNSRFESFLNRHGFKIYDDFRSNYYSTLSSNSSMFSMKHHYYNNTKKAINEVFNSREIIVGNNAVHSIFKSNDYVTNLLLEKSYLVTNRPHIAYDKTNFNFSEIPFFDSIYTFEKDLNEDLKDKIIENKKTKNFYFIEKLKPGHIITYEEESTSIAEQREVYLQELQEANQWLDAIITTITENDNNALIVIVADHGGFVGFNYTLESRTKQTDRDLVHSIFSAKLAIKWPNSPPDFDDKLKTNVNLFRVLFSYLAEDTTYLKNLQADKSYLMIDNGAPFGVYEVIDENGNVVFNKLKD